MQDYYFAPNDMLVIEVGKDQWIFNPRENKNFNNIFHFLTWEDEQSPDNNVFNTMEDFYNTFKYNKPFTIENLINAMNANNYITIPICKDDVNNRYEIRTNLNTKPVVGFIFQTKTIVLQNFTKHKMCEAKILQELQYYNQYINKEVYFINTYNEDGPVSYKNGIYEQFKELRIYDDYYSLGSYSCIQECLEDNPDLFKPTDTTGVRNKNKKNIVFYK